MELTNRLNLPSTIVSAIQRDPYHQDGDISATGLIQPPRIRQLTARYKTVLPGNKIALEQGKEGKTMRLNCGDNWYLEQKMEHGVIALYEKKAWGHRLSTVTNSWTEIISALQTLLKKGEKKDA